ncbi:MAG TPA: hypothetical protein VLX59_10190 [Acidimicrobiales bacterium]|nr:hypothetical protein [Acidimicrobiales bacterium]
MGRSSFRFRVRTAAKGVRARISASPDIWDETAQGQPDWATSGEDVSDWLELPPDFRAPDDDQFAYRRPSGLQMDLLSDEDFDDAAWSAYGGDDAPVQVMHLDQRP